MGFANLPIFATAADTHNITPTMKKITRRRKPTYDTAEILEARIAPATFTVTNVSNSGPGSLREAIVQSESNNTADTIVFKAGVAGTILLTGSGFSVTEPLSIIGPGSAKVIISGGVTSAFSM
jgi:hypothetical protein